MAYLRDLLPKDPSIQVRGKVDIAVEQIAYDSRRVEPGAVFFALAGTKTKGTTFLEQALDCGARAVVVPAGTVVPAGVTVITASRPRRLLGIMADEFYLRPSAQLTLIGVTGTSGKTTTTYVLEAIGKAMGWSVGVIGTVNYRYGDQTLSAPFTTPEAVELQALLRMMVAMQGRRGDTILVNGAVNPLAAVPNRLVRLRLVNASNARIYELSFSDRRSFHWIGTEGGLLEHAVALEAITLAPGQRAELLVDFTDGRSASLVTAAVDKDAEPTITPERMGCQIGAGLICTDKDAAGCAERRRARQPQPP